MAKNAAKKAARSKPAPAARKAVAKAPARKAKPSASRPKPKVKAAPAVKVASAKTVRIPAKSVLKTRSRLSDKPGSSGLNNVLIEPAKAAAASPLKSKDLELFKDLLLSKRRELLGDVASMESEALRSTSGSNLSNLPIHMADMGTDNYEQEFTLGLVEKDRQLLREINIALDKVRKGTYGICEGTGKPINRARLEAKPWARYSLEYTMKVEKGLVRR